RVVPGKELDERIRRSFLQDSMDHRILDTALRLHEAHKDRPVILLSKDTNLRMKAKSLGLRAQDYEADKVESLNQLYTGKRTIENCAQDLIARFYGDGPG